MREPSSDQELETRIALSPTTTVVLARAIAGVVFLGIFPGPLVSVAMSSTIPLP